MEKKGFYIPSIDGLRFLAFFLVYCRHFIHPVINDFLYQVGWTGVQLFFLISGYLLTKLLVIEYEQNKKISLKNYFLRRILRIWPLYFTYLVIISIIAIFYFGYIDYERLLGNIFFYDNFNSAFHNFNPNWEASHLWSISLEEQFYVLLPFLVPLLYGMNKKKILLVLSFVFLIIMASRFLVTEKNIKSAFVYVLASSVDCFLMGIMIGLGLMDAVMKKINPYLCFIMGIVLLISEYFIFSCLATNYYYYLYFYPIIAVGFALIFYSLLHSEKSILNAIFENRLMRYLGKISFGLYIFHLVAIFIVTQVNLVQNIEWMKRSRFISGLILTIIMAVISYELFEKRFLRMKQRFTIVKNKEV